MLMDIEQQWINYQHTNKSNIIRYDDFDPNTIQYVGGLDISFSKSDSNLACAYLTIYNILTSEIVYEDYKLCKLTIPYISGFLGFREVPEYKKLLKRIIGKPFYPQILLVDGFGILHYREFGSASHLGFITGIPTIGVGKTLLAIDGLNERTVKQEFKNKCVKSGDYHYLAGSSGKIWGAALKSTNDTFNPIYVTIGHKISLETALHIVTKCCKYRIPEPIRNSDIKSKLYL